MRERDDKGPMVKGTEARVHQGWGLTSPDWSSQSFERHLQDEIKNVFKYTEKKDS